MSIAVEHLTKRYDGVAVVADVSLAIATGELFTLLGPSGSGKSTLLRMVAGLTEVDGGRVLLHGRDVTGVSPKDRDVGFVFQNYALFRQMTVEDNVGFALRVRRVPAAERRRATEELIEMVGLAGFGRRRPWQLSGGQQQRVALARALAHRPRVLLLDEPFGALDAKIRVELRQTLRGIQRELGLTAIFVTHDQEEAFALADRIAVLHEGRLLEEGTPAELYLRPRTPFVATFLGAANLWVGESAPRAVKLGTVSIPLGTEAASATAPRRVQLLFRPEDVELTAEPAAAQAPLLGRATVEEASFVGAFERLRLRLDPLPGVRAVAPAPTYGGGFLWVDAVRPQHEALRLPLVRGEESWVGVRRVHVLASARLRLRVVPGTTPSAAAAGDLAVAMAAKTNAWIGAELPGEAPPADGGPADLVVAGLDPRADPGEQVDRLAATGRHLLLVPGPCRAPERLLICVAVGEPGKADVAIAERLAYHLGAAATVLTVLPEAQNGAGAPPHVERFLAASARVLGARGVEVATRVRFGPPRREILAELAAGGHDLLVVGAPLPQRPGDPFRLDGLVARLLAHPPPCPVLMVRSGGPE